MKSTFKVMVAAVMTIALTFRFFGVYGSAYDSEQKDSYTYLLAGFDDAAENTDVLCLVNCNFLNKSIAVLQIPRDTYYNFGASQNKINQVFSTLRARGEEPETAMRSLMGSLSKHFALSIDGYVGISTETFKNLITSAGGVYVTVREDMIIQDDKGNTVLSLRSGENLLDADGALTLVRHRRGYKRGDLQRIDTQKIFIDGLYYTLTKKLGYRELFNVLLNANGVVTDIPLAKVFSLFRRILSLGNIEPIALTVPGAAIRSKSGVWYYALNRRAVLELLEKYYPITDEQFDKEKRFLNSQESEFERIYYSTDL